jgi:hypothetical protein
MIILAAGMPRAGSGWHYNQGKQRKAQPSSFPQLRGGTMFRRSNPHDFSHRNMEEKK